MMLKISQPSSFIVLNLFDCIVCILVYVDIYISCNIKIIKKLVYNDYFSFVYYIYKQPFTYPTHLTSFKRSAYGTTV